MTLHTPIADGRRHFCGPTAIAAVTGATFDQVYKKIRRVRSDQDQKFWGNRRVNGGRVKDHAGRMKPVKGMHNSELIETMKRFGFKVKLHGSGTKPGNTLRQLLEDRGHLGPMIVQVTHHYIAVSRGMLCDTHTRHPIPMMEYQYLKKRVDWFWQFG